jgi:hypothetical protein
LFDRDQTRLEFLPGYYFRRIPFFFVTVHRRLIGAEGTGSDDMFREADIMRRSIFVFLVLCAASTTAHSQSLIPNLDAPGARGDLARAEKKKAEARFDATDTNKDGKLSREEVKDKSEFLTNNFDKRDADKDGFLNWEEFLGHNRWPR